MKILIVLLTVLLMEAGALAMDVNIEFSKDKWKDSDWKYLKVHPSKPLPDGLEPESGIFNQEAGCITTEFTQAQVSSGNDNALMIIDGINAVGEIIMEFEMDGGKGTAPGVCLFPTYDSNMVLENSIAIFTASYTTAVWLVKLDKAAGITRYKLLGMTVKWFDPFKRHTLRCRFGGNSIVVSVDDADPVHYWLQPWFPAIENTEADDGVMIEPNGKIGLWGCHGKCKFYSLKVSEKPSLPLIGEKTTGI